MNHNLTRQIIINKVKEKLEGKVFVHALWLEGSDALDCLDEYSDIDFVSDVEDGYEDEVFKIIENTLSQLGDLDINDDVFVNHPKIKQKIYHIKQSNDYLLIDFNIQSHSRKKEESTFVRGDTVEAAKVLFDKNNVVDFKNEDFTISDIKDEIKQQIEVFKLRYKQHSRILKYVKRNQYLEAYLYYMKYVVEPIVYIMRIKYTPKYHYLHLIHISNHIPDKDVQLLESFYKVSALDDIYHMTIKSESIFNQLVEDVLNLFKI